MPESELFKMALQGGMFGLWVLFMLWCLFRGVPMMKELVTKLSDSHTEAVRIQSDKNFQAMEKTNESHSKAVEMLTLAHSKAVDTLAKECREERMEMMEYIHAKLLPSTSTKTP